MVTSRTRWDMAGVSVAEWVALLRGVNVGGVTITSAEAVKVFEGLHFDGVRTVAASGNVRFATRRTARARLKTDIEAALSARFDYVAWIVVVTLAELQQAVAAFPFDADDRSRQPYVVFGSDQAALDELEQAAEGLDAEADPVRRGHGVLYWNPVKGTTLTSPFGKLLGKPRYKATTTNRNLRTLITLQA